LRFWNLQALRHQKQETLPDQEGKMTTLIFPTIHLSQLLSRLRRKLHAAAPTASVVIAVPIILAPIVAAQTAALAAASRIVPSPAAPTAAAMIAGIVPGKVPAGVNSNLLHRWPDVLVTYLRLTIVFDVFIFDCRFFI
jgi:hypothetical protein